VAPLIGLDDPARQNRTIRGEWLAGDFEPELVKAAERSHVGAGEAGSGVASCNVEVFRMGLV
jgi:hypothetical protein